MPFNGEAFGRNPESPHLQMLLQLSVLPCAPPVVKGSAYGTDEVLPKGHFAAGNYPLVCRHRRQKSYRSPVLAPLRTGLNPPLMPQCRWVVPPPTSHSSPKT